MKRTTRLDILSRLVREFNIDVLMLAENTLGVADVLCELNTSKAADFHYNTGKCERIDIFSKFTQAQMEPLHESDHITIRHLKPSTTCDLLLVVAHLSSKLHQSSESQAFETPGIANDIIRMENKIGHKRTILVGDLNMNPFEIGLVAASGFNATMSRKIADKKERRVTAQSFPFFYNPMWSLLGDASDGPPGSYYCWKSEQVAYFWHMFDQVLLRPDVLPMFQNNTLKIIDRVGELSLLNRNGIPDTKISDHLPILFQLTC
jgi:hypothetical protein